MNVKEAYDYSFAFLKANGVDEAENKALMQYAVLPELNSVNISRIKMTL